MAPIERGIAPIGLLGCEVLGEGTSVTSCFGENLRDIIRQMRVGVGSAQQEVPMEGALEFEFGAVVPRGSRVIPNNDFIEIRVLADVVARRIETDGAIVILVSVELFAFCADVGYGKIQPSRQFALDVEVPLLGVGIDNPIGHRVNNGGGARSADDI